MKKRESYIFITIAFIGAMPVDQIVTMVLTQALFKTFYEIVVFPLTNVIIKKVRNIESGNIN